MLARWQPDSHINLHDACFDCDMSVTVSVSEQWQNVKQGCENNVFLIYQSSSKDLRDTQSNMTLHKHVTRTDTHTGRFLNWSVLLWGWGGKQVQGLSCLFSSQFFSQSRIWARRSGRTDPQLRSEDRKVPLSNAAYASVCLDKRIQTVFVYTRKPFLRLPSPDPLVNFWCHAVEKIH